MYAYLIRAIIRDIEFNLQNADNKDVERSAFTAGAVTAYTDILRNIGHEVNHGDWTDNGCSRVGYLEIDGKVPTTALCRFVDQLNTARRFMWNKATKAKCSVDAASQFYRWRFHYDFCWY